METKASPVRKMEIIKPDSIFVLTTGLYTKYEFGLNIGLKVHIFLQRLNGSELLNYLVEMYAIQLTIHSLNVTCRQSGGDLVGGSG